VILPTKFLDPTVGVLQVSASILSVLRATPVVSMNELRVRSLSGLRDRARFNFVGALSVLFLLGAIEYDSAADVVELVTARTER
jgi:hypothetical protein